jgi:hypothetical protein
MRKIVLDLDRLHVESFITDTRRGARGTVHAAGAAAGDAPAPSGCTDPCMSEDSWCPILSCGSDCVPDTQPATGVLPG